jgi:hypothetical protein
MPPKAAAEKKPASKAPAKGKISGFWAGFNVLTPDSSRGEERGRQEDRCHWREEEENEDAQGDLLFLHLQRYDSTPIARALRPLGVPKQLRNRALNSPNIY